MKTQTNKIQPTELAFDIDGVIADTFRAFVSMAREHYGIKVEYHDITEYDFMKVIDIDERTLNEIIERILEDPLGIGIEPMKGSVEVLTRLKELGPIILVTARPDKAAILEWMQEHFHFNDGNGICLEATGTYKQKLPILLNHGIKYFVEDRLETCYLLDEASVTPIVFEQPWNQKNHPFQTVKSWDEISAMIHW
jgi:uncharacterized HAD superfamily protein